MRTRSEVSTEAIRQSDAATIFVKLRKMIASDTQTTDTILGTIAVAAHSLTGATGAAIAMPQGGAVVCVGRSGESAPELGDRLNVESGISGECLRTGVILRCDDASRDFHVDAEVCRQLGLQSIAVVPLRGQHGRVGVLEAFSTQSYAFTEDTMELLGRLAGLAEAAWARGAVTEAPAVDEVPSLGQAAAVAVVEAPLEPAPPSPAAVPLAQVQAVFASAQQQEEARSSKRRRYAIMAATTLLLLGLVSFYSWSAWYQASIKPRKSQASSSPEPPLAASQNENATADPGFSPQADIVRPASPPGLPVPRAAAPAAEIEIPDTVIRRQPRANQKANGATASPQGPAHSGSIAEDVPPIAASGAASEANPAELTEALATAPALPQLGVPISQGVAGGLLVHKVQPVYPPEARRLNLAGTVVIDATVTPQGQIHGLKVVSGHPVLAAAAVDAVHQWRYTPYLLNGQPVAKPTRITITFIAPR